MDECKPLALDSSDSLIAALADLCEPLILRGAATGWPAMAPDTERRYEWSLSRLLR